MADDRTNASRPRHRIFIVSNPDDNDSDGDAPRSFEQQPPHSAGPTKQHYGDSAPRPRPLAPPPLNTHLPKNQLPRRSNPPLSSPSSSSSPAVDTTPPPSTPGQSGSLDLTPDGNSRRDVASPPVNGRPDVPLPQPWGEPPPLRQVNPISPPAHFRNASDHARPLPSPTVTEKVAITEKTLIMVTIDSELLYMVDISGAREPAFIREKIFSKLCIPDEDQLYYSIYRHEIGSYATGEALTDNQLFAICRDRGDANGTLKFFVLHSSAAAHESAFYPRPPVHLPGHIPPVFQPETDANLRPLQPRRQRSRSGRDSISDASDRFPIRESGSASYDASVSDGAENDRDIKRTTIRAPPRQLPSTHGAQSGAASSPHVSPIPDCLRPHSPLTNLPPPLPLPREGETQPLVINKTVRSPPVQPAYPHSPRGLDTPRDEGFATVMANGAHSRSPSEAGVDIVRPARLNPSLIDSPDTPSLVYSAPAREEKDRTEQLRRRNGIIKPEWGLKAVGSSDTMDSKASSGPGEWVMVSPEISQRRASPTSASTQESARFSPAIPSSRLNRRKSQKNTSSPVRATFKGQAIPNQPRIPPPPPPIPGNDTRSPKQNQPISAGMTKRWHAAPNSASKGDNKSLASAKSMVDLRGSNGLPIALAPGRPSTSRRPSAASRPSTGSRVDNQAMLEQGLNRAKAEASSAQYSARSGGQPPSSMIGRPPVRPLPVLDGVAGRGPPSGSALSSAALSSASLSSAALSPAAFPSASLFQSFGSSGSYQPSSADRTQSPTSARLRRTAMPSPPTLPDGSTMLSHELGRSSAMTAASSSHRPQPVRPTRRDEEGTNTAGALHSISSQPHLRERVPPQVNGYSNISTSLPRDPITIMRPPRTDSRDALSHEQTGQAIRASPADDDDDDELTFKPENRDIIRKMLADTDLSEGTLKPRFLGDSKQSTAPPTPAVLPPQKSAYSWGTPLQDDDDDEDEEDTGTLWVERPKSVVQPPLHSPGRPNVPPIHTRDFLNYPPPTLPASTSPTRALPGKPSVPTEPFARGERPNPEDVYERLDAYFPQHDLDKPVLDATSGGVSPTSGDAPVHFSPPTVAPPSAYPPPQLRTRHKKSIRVVAAEHKKRIDRTSRLPSAVADVARKRSTKLWGSKLEEVTSSQAQAIVTDTTDPNSTASPKPIFKWVRGELIGKGTYGRVYVALNATTGEMIAVKQVEMPRTASDREDSRQVTVVEALKSESETLKDLDHPHIVQYLGFEETPEFLSIFLEYVPGGSVGSCLRKHGKFSENVTKSFTQQILEGLEYLHSKGVLHRDLKADNILVDFAGICKISDFGISKRTDDVNQGAAFTAMQGTVFWMAPEVVKTNKKGYTFKIDIWSIGCIVLEMWAGRRPWNDEEAVTVMYKLYHQDQIPPVPTGVTLSQAGDDFRQKCFAINPEERPNACELRRHPYLESLPGWWSFKDFKSE